MGKDILIIGAGISGLLLAQRLRQEGIPFRLFERDNDLSTRGVGWGLTLHWSLPALRELLPDNLVQALPDAYVDRKAVEKGALSTFPFYDLSTGELKSTTPKAPESQRIRVTRDRLRRILATDLTIEWDKCFSSLELKSDGVTAKFEDGSEAEGSLLIACDGGQSRVRRALFPDQSETFKIPVRMLGVKLTLTPEQFEPIRQLDPFFLQGTSSQDNSFVYISVLDAPESNVNSTNNYVCQMCLSWPYRSGFLGKDEPLEIPETNSERLDLIHTLAAGWKEPFRAVALGVSAQDEIKDLIPQDFPPPQDLHSPGRAVLMGDAVHAMAMYRGEAANHVIVDALDFVQKVLPQIKNANDSTQLDTALHEYETSVIERTRPAVLASRQACLDAHDWSRINTGSPLLTRREMFLKLN